MRRLTLAVFLAFIAIPLLPFNASATWIRYEISGTVSWNRAAAGDFPCVVSPIDPTRECIGTLSGTGFISDTPTGEGHSWIFDLWHFDVSLSGVEFMKHGEGIASFYVGDNGWAAAYAMSLSSPTATYYGEETSPIGTLLRDPDGNWMLPDVWRWESGFAVTDPHVGLLNGAMTLTRAVPEPASLLLLGVGILGLLVRQRVRP